MKQLYNLVVDKITTDIPEVKWIDFDFGQLETQENPPVLFPCSLLTIAYPDVQGIKKDDRITAEVSIKLGFYVPLQTNGSAPAQMKVEAQKYLDIFEKTQKKISGFKPDGHSAFRLSSANPDILPNNVRTITLTFSTRFTQTST